MASKLSERQPRFWEWIIACDGCDDSIVVSDASFRGDEPVLCTECWIDSVEEM